MTKVVSLVRQGEYNSSSVLEIIVLSLENNMNFQTLFI